MALAGGFPRIPIQNGCKECGANLLFVADLPILEEVFDKNFFTITPVLYAFARVYFKGIFPERWEN